MSVPRRRSIRFAAEIPAATAGSWENTIRVDSTVELIRVVFPPGPSGLLEILPLVDNGEQNYTRLIETDDLGATEAFVRGDDIDMVFHVAVPVERTKKLRVEYDNKDVLPHFVDVVFEVEELAGLGRVV